MQTVPTTGDAPKPAPRRAATHAIAGCLIIALGAALRIRAWSHWRSLWNDEIFLAHNIVTRGLFPLLFHPLDLNQAAPPLFLAAERLAVDLFGSGERALRLPSLLAGLITLPLFHLLARRLLSPRGRLLAMFLFAILAPLIYYSSEVKQYQWDVAVTLAILLTATEVWRNPQSHRCITLYALAGALGIFSSHVAPFAMAGTGLVLLTTNRIWKSALPLLKVAAIWAVLELANYYLFLLPVEHGPSRAMLYNFWLDAGAFPPESADAKALLPWIGDRFTTLFSGYNTLFLTAPNVALLAAIVGATILVIGPRPIGAALLLAPLPLALAAAIARKYPFGDRLALYTAPILCLLIAAGIDTFWGKTRTRLLLGLLIAAMILTGPMLRAYYTFRRPTEREETKQAYEWIANNFQPGDAIFLYHKTPSYDYYAPKTNLAGLRQLWECPTPTQKPLEESAQGIGAQPWFNHAFASPNSTTRSDGFVILQSDHSDHPELYLTEIDGLIHPDPAWNWPPIKRIWLVLAGDWEEHLDQLCVPELDHRASRVEHHLEPGSDVYLYELPDQK
jgi:hypothetical protein